MSLFRAAEAVNLSGIRKGAPAFVAVSHDDIRGYSRGEAGGYCSLATNPSREWRYKERSVREQDIPDHWSLPTPGEPFIFARSLSDYGVRIYQCAGQVDLATPQKCWSVPTRGNDPYGLLEKVSLRWRPMALNGVDGNIMARIAPDVREVVLRKTAKILMEILRDEIEESRRKMGYPRFLQKIAEGNSGS
jgi:hypothetical protein